jgi:hypothetical protein
LKGIRLGTWTVEFDHTRVEYEVTGPGADESIKLLQEVMPEIHFITPKFEELKVYADFIEGVEKRAVEKYKRENGITE